MEAKELKKNWFGVEYLEDIPKEISETIKSAVDKEYILSFFFDTQDAKFAFVKDFFMDICLIIPKSAWKDVFNKPAEQVKLEILKGNLDTMDDLLSLYSEFAEITKIRTKHGDIWIECRR